MNRGQSPAKKQKAVSRTLLTLNLKERMTMIRSHKFSPTLSDTLETRTTPSAVFATSHAFSVFTQSQLTSHAITSPGATSPIHTATNGEPYILRSVVVKPAVVKAATITSVPTYPAGTFSNGLPPIHIATNGEPFLLR